MNVLPQKLVRLIACGDQISRVVGSFH